MMIKIKENIIYTSIKIYLRSGGFSIETENKAGEAKDYGQNNDEHTGFAAEVGSFRIWNKIMMGHSSYSCSRHASCQCLIDKIVLSCLESTNYTLNCFTSIYERH